MTSDHASLPPSTCLDGLQRAGEGCFGDVREGIHPHKEYRKRRQQADTVVLTGATKQVLFQDLTDQLDH